MAALNQEIYIGSVSDPLFYFDKDHINEPSSMQGVDLIGETLSIDTFEPVVYYDGIDYDGLRTLPFGTPVFYYTSGVLTYKFYINKITRQSKKAFKLECVSVIGLLDKTYDPGGVYYGTPFRDLAYHVISKRVSEAFWASAVKPSSGVVQNVTVIGEYTRVTLNGTASANGGFTFGNKNPYVSFSTAAQFYANAAYSCILTSGHTYRITLKFESGSIVASGTTYTPSSTITSSPHLFRAFLMKNGGSAWSDNWISTNWNLTSSSSVVIDADECAGLMGYVYSGVTYNNAVFTCYLEDLSELPFSISEEVGSTKIFGWLPYDTKRNNLHQMLFATNASVLKDENGDMYFTYLDVSGTPPTIPDDRIYIDGEVEYPTVATEIDVTEHSFQYVSTIDPVTLFDNSDSIPTENLLVIFNEAPIAVSSIKATSELTIVEKHENYAIVSGFGVLTGIPYVDKASIVRRYHNSQGENYTVTVDGATLVTAMNSAFVADRLKSYYTSAKIVKGKIKLSGEHTGHRYSFKDAFEEQNVGYLKKITTYSSSFVRGDCEFVSGYNPEEFGNSYDYHLAVDTPGIIHVPEGTTAMRVTLIGGGDGASSGLAGEDPEFDPSSVYTVYKNQEGGKGGEPGEEGLGGWIREVIISNPPAGDWTTLLGLGGEGVDWNYSSTDHARSENYVGGDTELYSPDGTTYSTNDPNAYRSDSGIVDLFTSIVYAKKGRAGVKGGNGGRGSANGPGEAGEDVTYAGYIFAGGAGGSGRVFSFERVERTANAGGAGGSGASAYGVGSPGGDAEVSYYYDATASASGYKAVEYVGIVGGSPLRILSNTGWQYDHTPGDGGHAGCGGPGRGGYGSADRFTDKYDVTENSQTLHVLLQADLFRATPIYTYSGRGGYGEQGYQGAIIIYSDKPLTYTPNLLNTPTITNTTTSSSTGVTFTFVNVNDNITYAIERRPIDGTWVQIARASYEWQGATCTYVDNTPSSGDSYEYRIKALGLGLAKDSEYSNSIIAGYGKTKLAAPTVTATQQTWGVKFSWTSVPNANAYVWAYREVGTDNDWSYLRFVITDPSVALEEGMIGAGGRSYEVKVCAFTTDKSYVASDWSNTVTGTTPATGKCATPVITSAEYYDAGGTYDTDGVMLRWEAYYIGGDEIYVIQRKKHSSTAWETVAESTNPRQGYYFNSFSTSVSDQYDYRVKGIKDGWADSEWSAVYTVTIEHSLPAPIFEKMEDAGKNYVTCNIEVTGIDSHAQYIHFEISVNGGSWQAYKSIALTGSQSYAGTYAEPISGGAMKYGGSIRLRCYVSASGYDNSGYSEIKELSFKERVFFWDGENNRYWDNATKSYKTGTGGWKGVRIYYDNGSGGYEYYEAATFTKASDGTISLTSNGHLMTTNPACDLGTSLSTAYSRLCFTGKLVKSYSEGASLFGSCNLWKRSNGYTFIDWRSSTSAYSGVGYVQAGTSSRPGELIDGSVAPISKNSSNVGGGIGTFIGFQLNGGSISFSNIFAIKR